MGDHRHADEMQICGPRTIVCWDQERRLTWVGTVAVGAKLRTYYRNPYWEEQRGGP